MRRHARAIGFALAVSVLVAGCASQPAQTTVDKGVVGAEQSLTLAYQVADQYARLPRCKAPGATVICSDQAVLAKMVILGRKATDAVMAARSNQALLGAAFTAIQDFQAVFPR